MAFFELNDIKRDRQPYKTDQIWHLPLWSPSITNNFERNLKKAMVGTVMASCLVEPMNHLWHSMKTLNLVYEWPKSSAQWSIFIRESLKVPFFWSELRKKVVFGSIQWTMDFGMRFASLKKFYGGSWSPVCFHDFNIIKNIFFAWASAIPVCWIGIPFETARRAYYADLTWPAELRKGFRSPLHALCKIPFTEGPLYLFKGGLLTYVGNVQFTAFTFLFYTWLKNKAFFLWLYNDLPYDWVKFWCMNISFTAGSIFGYPIYYLKEMVETWPKERGGHDTFKGSYYNALKFLKQNYDIYNTSFYEGYWRWFRTQGIIFYIAMWQADNMGLINNFKSDPNTLSNIVSFSESD